MVVKFRTKYAEGYQHPFIVMPTSSWFRNRDKEIDMVEWIHDIFGDYGDRWVIKWDGWGFKYEEDRNWFLLRWS